MGSGLRIESIATCNDPDIRKEALRLICQIKRKERSAMARDIITAGLLHGSCLEPADRFLNDLRHLAGKDA